VIRVSRAELGQHDSKVVDLPRQLPPFSLDRAFPWNCFLHPQSYCILYWMVMLPSAGLMGSQPSRRKQNYFLFH
jgi:hypothetical protein